MAIAQGFGKSASTGLVFAYDTGDMDNSYRGAPGQNYAFGPNRSYGGPSTQNFENGKIFRSNGYTETVFIPTLGVRSVESIEIYNEYDGYGTNGNYNCCPNIFNYVPSGWGSFTWLPNTTYTYQIIYKSETGYTHPNYMYHYEYRANGSYITEYGVHTEGLRTHLGDGWYHAWNTFTSHPEAATGFCGCWHYEYYGRNKVSVAAVSIVPGTTIRPPRQFIDEGTTRTSTQGLLDLTGNSTINLSNVSYNSTGGILFDGTDDYIDITKNLGTLSQYTIEHVSYKGSENKMPINARTNTSFYQYGDNSWAYTHGGVWGEYYYPKSFTINGWGHWVITYTGSHVKIYRNGVFEGQQATTGTADWTNGMRIGQHGPYGGYNWNGQIAVVKMYNRALSAAEVSQNYRHYKTRFNL
jgi:hypothetical protein